MKNARVFALLLSAMLLAAPLTACGTNADPDAAAAVDLVIGDQFVGIVQDPVCGGMSAGDRKGKFFRDIAQAFGFDRTAARYLNDLVPDLFHATEGVADPVGRLAERAE